MNNNSVKAKEHILKKIRQALATPVPVPFPQSEGGSNLYQPLTRELELEFAENFTGLLGKFVFCLDYQELAGQLQTLVDTRKFSSIYCAEPAIKKQLSGYGFSGMDAPDVHGSDAAITTCEYLVARTGSILLSSATQSGRTASVYTPVHICIAYSNQLVYDIEDAINGLKEKYAGNLPSMLSLASGPSRTADIEKTLVVGIHGPKEVYVFLVDSPGL